MSSSSSNTTLPKGDPPSYEEHTQHTLCEAGESEFTESNGSTPLLTQPSGADKLADWLVTLTTRGIKKGG
jgi:hypothetical protein